MPIMPRYCTKEECSEEIVDKSCICETTCSMCVDGEPVFPESNCICPPEVIEVEEDELIDFLPTVCPDF